MPVLSDIYTRVWYLRPGRDMAAQKFFPVVHTNFTRAPQDTIFMHVTQFWIRVIKFQNCVSSRGSHFHTINWCACDQDQDIIKWSRGVFTVNQAIKMSAKVAIKHIWISAPKEFTKFFTDDNQEPSFLEKWDQAIKAIFWWSNFLIPVASASIGGMEVTTTCSCCRVTDPFFLTPQRINSNARAQWPQMCCTPAQCPRVPVNSISRSAKVLFPWSTWATIQKFRIFSCGTDHHVCTRRTLLTRTAYLYPTSVRTSVQ